MNNHLPMLAGQLTDEHLTPFIPKEVSGFAFSKNDILLLARDNPELMVPDFISFVQQAYLTGADPRIKQIYLTTRRSQVTIGNVKQWVTKGQAIFSYHFFITKARTTGELRDLKVEHGTGSYFNPGSGQVFETAFAKATATRGDSTMTFTAWFPEFVQTKDAYENNQKTGAKTIQENWLRMPYVMLGKCAIANVLRLLFSDVLQGMYFSEEITGEISAEHKDVTPLKEIVKTEVKAEIKPATVVIKEPDVAIEPEIEKQEHYNDEGPSLFDVSKIQEEKDTSPIAGKNSKTKIWNLMQSVAKTTKGFDLNKGLIKMQSQNLTENLATKLVTQLESGDLTWFQ